MCADFGWRIFYFPLKYLKNQKNNTTETFCHVFFNDLKSVDKCGSIVIEAENKMFLLKKIDILQKDAALIDFIF